jgi:hypothetical protein
MSHATLPTTLPYDYLADAEPGQWLWCSECDRFFQAQHLRLDPLGNRQGCAFCVGNGFGIDIFAWNDSTSDHWPSFPGELHHGARADASEAGAATEANTVSEDAVAGVDWVPPLRHRRLRRGLTL